MAKYREFIREILGDRVVAYYPCLAHRFGVKSAILLSQLFHYASLQEDPEGWFHAKIETITNHTGLSRKEQGAARKVLSQWGVLKVDRRSMPRKNWYLVDLEALVVAVSEGEELPEPSSQESPKGNHKEVPKVTACEAQRDPCIKESFKEGSIKEDSRSNDRGKGKKERDPLLDHPAIIEFRDETRLHVLINWRKEVAETVGDDPEEVKRWRAVVHDWMGRGWNKQNVKGMLEVFRNPERKTADAYKEKSA